jgi:Holliday junction resolvase - archaeal type
MGKMSRDKGKRGELELAKILREYGYETRRGQQFCGAKGDADVIGLPGIHIEVKRVEKLNLYEAVKQSVRDSVYEDLPAVFHRKNNQEWLVTMRLTEWMEMYKAYTESKDEYELQLDQDGNVVGLKNLRTGHVDYFK